MSSEQDEVKYTSQSGKTNRPKGSRVKGNVPHWRREQLRMAGRARGEQLKQDKEHQRKAGKARAARGDMKELAAKGNAKANEKDPNHQSNARRGKKKSKPGNNDKTIRNAPAEDITRNDESSEDKFPHQIEDATGEEEKHQ